MSPSEELSIEETRKALFFLVEVKANSVKTKDKLIKVYKERDAIGKT